jgi:hypothetical protein
MESDSQATLLAALRKLACGNLTLRDQETLANVLHIVSDEQMQQVVWQLGPTSFRDCLDWCRRGLGARVPNAFSWHWRLANRLEVACASNPEVSQRTVAFQMILLTDLVGRFQDLLKEVHHQPLSKDRLRQVTDELGRLLVDEQQRQAELTAEIQHLDLIQAQLQQAADKAQLLTEQRNQARQTVDELRKHADELTEMCSGSETDPWLELFREHWKFVRALLPEAAIPNVENQLRLYPQRWIAVTSLLQQLRTAFAEFSGTRDVLERAQKEAFSTSSGQN